mmetsp:Transcript_61975/g.139525  ORF Transcript_61975/g.139525 Transcript_61975/m.139525 type:complete len:216 (+) Transcript_61975:1621-2268(+)
MTQISNHTIPLKKTRMLTHSKTRMGTIKEVFRSLLMSLRKASDRNQRHFLLLLLMLAVESPVMPNVSMHSSMAAASKLLMARVREYLICRIAWLGQKGSSDSGIGTSCSQNGSLGNMPLASSDVICDQSPELSCRAPPNSVSGVPLVRGPPTAKNSAACLDAAGLDSAKPSTSMLVSSTGRSSMATTSCPFPEPLCSSSVSMAFAACDSKRSSTR